MNYSTGRRIRIGDTVVAHGSPGIVVCDFDNREYLPDYADFKPKGELNGGGELMSGVMIKTEEMGLVHYPEEYVEIVYVDHSK